MNRPGKFFFFFTFILFFTISFPSISSAHAYIKNSTPSNNQILANSPKTISIEFNENIQAVFHSIRILDMNGKEAAIEDSHVDSKNHSIIECSLKSQLADGTYRVEWKVVSDDGHPEEGVIPFGIGEAGADQTNVNSQSTGYFPQLDLVVIRGIQFISGSILTGLIFFYLFVIKNECSLEEALEKRYQKIILFSFGFLCLSVLLNLPLQITIEANVSWKRSLDFSFLKNMLGTSLTGKVWISQVSLLIFLFFSLSKAFVTKRNSLFFWNIAFFLCCFFLLAKSFTSHAFTTDSPFTSTMMDFLHLLGASIWTGSLMAMIILLPLNRQKGKSQYKQLIREFFQWGVMIVLVLIITGLYSSFQYVSTIDSLVTTDYGRILLAKVLLFIVMLGFALVNFLKGKTEKEKWLGFSLKGELLIGTIILILAVFLTNLPTAASAPSSFNQTITLNKNERVTLKIDPKIIGPNHFDVTFKDQNEKALTTIQQVSLTFIPPGQNAASDVVNIPQIQSGRFYTQGMDINESGKWKIHLHILTRDLEDQGADFTVTVGKR